jgi:hypothetical protein
MNEVQSLLPKGRWVVEHFRDGEKIGTYDLHNAITNQGKNYLLNAAFNAGTQIAAANWSIGLIDGSGTPALAAGDTLGGHPGWNEFTNYAGNRPAWGQGSASGQSLTNATPASYTIGGTGSLYGIFIASVVTGGTGSDILWSTAAFSAPVPVAGGDIMKSTYTLAT